MKLQQVAIGRLKQAPYNPRTLTDKHRKALQRSLDEFGLVEPLVWNKQTGHVVGGNQRLALLYSMGVKKVDVVIVDLPLDREKLLNLRLNKLSGEWDDSKLSDMLKELDPADWCLTGFDDVEIEPLIGVLPQDADGKEFDESCAGDVKMTTCPKCGEEFPV